MHIYTFLAKITKRSLKTTLLQSISINFAFECIRNIEHSYILKTAHSLSPPQRPHSIVGRLEKGKKKARGGQWKGKREEARFFPPPIVPRALSIFRLFLFLLGCPAGSCAEKTGSFSLAKALNFVFKAQFRRRTFHEPNLIRIKADPNKNNNNFILCRHKELKGCPANSWKASRAGASQVHE